MRQPQNILQQYFGHSVFRPGQLELIKSILDGNDAFGIMPTGGGKSICYQVPALILDGITLVISPLVSLMQDQIFLLNQNGIDAAFINSQLSESQIDRVLVNAHLGKYKIVYVAPERLQSPKFLDFCYTSNISFVAVDEAHCVSQWGQDFRPSYSRIATFVSHFRRRPVVGAYTATATHLVRADVVNLLNLKNPTTIQNSFDRSNLKFEVVQPDDRYRTLVHLLKSHQNKCGIVYCSTRKTVNDLFEKLKKAKFAVGMYHAGLSDSDRQGAQEDFIFDRINTIVATNAFGMGIDKSNVSYVIHYNMPKDIESYYQEAGRAGRDGSDATCTLLYNGQDMMTNLFFIESEKDKQYESEQQKVALQARSKQRLRAMQRYCTTDKCLRNYILEYFEEHRDKSCGNCGSCDKETIEYDITILAQKILSCVVRTNQLYGVNTIVDILIGSKNKKILSNGLDRQTTYGICTESEAFVKSTIDYLIDEDYLYQTTDKFVSLKLGRLSARVLKDREQLFMTTSVDILQREKSIKKYNGNSDDFYLYKTASVYEYSNQIDNELLQTLKTLRKEIANEQKVPSFVIFHDSSLIDMAKKLPQNLDEFGHVSGVGKRKLDMYGDKFVQCIIDFLDKNNTVKVECVKVEDDSKMTDESMQANLYKIFVNRPEFKNFNINYDISEFSIKTLDEILSLLKKGSKKGTLTYEEISKTLKNIELDDKASIELVLKILNDNKMEILRENTPSYIEVDDTEHFENIKTEVQNMPDLYLPISDIIRLLGVRLQSSKANDWLTHIGYLDTTRTDENKLQRNISQIGVQSGIIQQQRIGKDDKPYNAILYPQHIILQIIDNLKEIIDFENN